MAPTIEEQLTLMKDIMATGKRSQVARLVCELNLLVILSLVTYRILEKDLVLEMFS